MKCCVSLGTERDGNSLKRGKKKEMTEVQYESGKETKREREKKKAELSMDINSKHVVISSDLLAE